MDNFNFFDGIDNIVELETKYRELAKKYHPDASKEDTTEIMKKINTSYKKFHINFEKLNNKTRSENKWKTKTPEQMEEDIKDFINIINVLINYDDILMEVCGDWLWVYCPKDKKDVAKELGFCWSIKKQCGIGEKNNIKVKAVKSLVWTRSEQKTDVPKLGKIQ